MAVWTNPTTRVTEERISQSIWNTDVVENLTYLYDALAAFMFGRSITKYSITVAAASLDIQNIPQTGGDLIITGVFRPATDDVGLYLRLNNHSGGTDYGWQYTSSDSQIDSSDSEIEILSGITAGNGVGNAAGEEVTFMVRIPNYAEVIGSTVRGVLWSATWRRATDGAPLANSGGGSLFFAEAVSRVTLLFETGNITEGSARLEITGP